MPFGLLGYVRERFGQRLLVIEKVPNLHQPAGHEVVVGCGVFGVVEYQLLIEPELR